MNFYEYLEKTNEEYKKAISANKDLNKDCFDRQALLNLSSIGYCQEKELENFIKANFKNAERLTLKQLQKPLKEKYMLSILYDAESHKPIVKELYDVWLNLESGEVSVIKPYNPFTDDDFCIKLDDYRNINENIQWFDLTI